MPFVEFENRRIAFEVQPESFDPSGFSMVFIHGSGGDRDDWRHQLDGLREICNVIAVELPGHGMSDKPGETSVDSYSRCVEGLVQKLNLPRVMIVGCSLGSAITQTIALNPKPWLKAIGLVGAGARLRVMPQLLQELLDSPQKALENLSAYCLSESAPETLKLMIRQKFVVADPILVHGDLSACDKFDVTKEISGIKVPTLIVVGADDRLTPLKYSKFLNDSISGSEMCAVENAGHLVMIEQPQEFNNAIETFLKKLLKTF